MTRVIHPKHLAGEPAARTAKYLTRGFGGLVGFELAGGAEAGRRFVDALKLPLPCRQYRRCAQPGDPSGEHDAFQLSAEEQARSGVTPGYVRLSIGLEHIDDIWRISTRRSMRPRRPIRARRGARRNTSPVRGLGWPAATDPDVGCDRRRGGQP